MPTPASVLRIGPTSIGESAQNLRHALLDFFKVDEPKEANVKETDGILHVNNKYFSARVVLEELGSDYKGKEDGIILVFDALGSKPDRENVHDFVTLFDALSVVHDDAQKNEECGDLLRLCVGVFLGEVTAQELRGNNHEEEYSRRGLWCLDRGYEYVEADLSLEGRKRGHDEREKDGFARIVESISSTMWSSAVMKSSRTNHLERSFEGERTESPEKESKDYSLPGPASTTTDDEFSTPSGVLVSENKENGEPHTSTDQQKEDDQERTFDELERIVGEARRLREASVGGVLSDSERKQRAGDTALLMMDLMEKLKFGNDDDEDRSSSESSSLEDEEMNQKLDSK